MKMFLYDHLNVFKYKQIHMHQEGAITICSGKNYALRQASASASASE